ncbi:MAG TPA: RsmB/NOP family class I SAM-dependent RNA methyltransferase [Burkholderiales bacterium]|nr:RsmB/NOP family class I SAM-dependent RNA methyltransferase [Burkholderiales bacterium]
MAEKKVINNKLVRLCESLLKEVLDFKIATDRVLADYFYKNKLGKSERYIIAETIYLILRNYFKITTALSLTSQTNNNQFKQSDYIDIIGITWIKLMKMDESYFENISSIEFEKFERFEFRDDILSKSELPQWIIDKLNNYEEKEIIELGRAMQEPALLNLRVNLLKTDRKSVLDFLKKEGIAARVTQYSLFGICLINKSFLGKNDLFIKGLIEIQDESSQLAGMLFAPRRGEMIVDFCAGSGGKSLLIGMLTYNTGRVYAFDINEKRLNNLTPRLKRSGLSNIYPQLITGEKDNKVKRLSGKIDRVFVDVPCSGFGTLRRNPDIKFRKSQSDILELTIKQLSILTEASKLVKKGGYLLYATCSILYEENQGIVNTFLQQNQDFKIIPAATVLKNINIKFIDENFLILLPHIHITDGFFAALMQKS